MSPYTGHSPTARPATARLTGLVLILGALMGAACGSSEPERANVVSEPADDSSTTLGSDNPGNAADGDAAADDNDTDSGPDDPDTDDTAAESPSSDNSGSGSAGLPEEIQPRRLTLPRVPAITLPDLSILNEGGTVIQDQLSEVVVAGSGVDVLAADCTADDAELVYQGSTERDTFFDVAADGSGNYVDKSGSNDITIMVGADGSGTFRDKSASNDVSIMVSADGSGTYEDESASTRISLNVDADGFGTYTDNTASNDVTITLNEDGSGLFVDDSASNAIRLEVNADGSGTFDDDTASTEVTITGSGDESFTYSDGSASTDIELVVNPDGSGSFRDKTASADLSITVDAEGNGVYTDQSAGQDTEYTFTTELGILDPGLISAEPRPVFAVADRFPPLATLGQFEPPCVTVIRLDANVLFDFDSAELRPEAQPVLDEVAATLVATGKPIEVHGHTDAIGSDDYNLDLSERRATAFADALQDRNVDSEIEAIGFGESRPAAPNTKPDGSDDPAGRQLNRRIEIVIPG